MVSGLDRREQVQDPLAPNYGAKANPGSVPVPGVSAPRGADFSKVGDEWDTINKLVGSGKAVYKDYIDKKSTEWALEGQMKYAQGVTEADLAKEGNRYTMAGFMTMKAKTAGNEWYQSAVDGISKDDKELSSEQYQAKLAGQWKELVDTTAGQDEFTTNLMTAIASENFPKLVELQVKENNGWRRKEQKSSFTTTAVSDATMMNDPADKRTEAEKLEALRQRTSHEASGLSHDDYKEAITEAVNTANEMKQPALMKALGWDGKKSMQDLEKGTNLPPGLVSAVLGTESNNKNYTPTGAIVTSPKGAQYAMQVMPATQADPGFGITPAKDNSPEEVNRVGRDYLSAMVSRYPVLDMAIAAYNGGFGTVDAAMKKYGDAWLAHMPKETQDYVNKVNGKLAPANPLEFKRDLGLDEEYGVQLRMLKEGFTPAQAESVMKSYRSMQDAKASEFNEQRIMTEAGILKSVKNTGNLEQGLQQIRAIKEANGYGDKWAEGISGKAVEASMKYEEERTKNMELDGTMQKGTGYTLTGEKKDKAVDRERARIQGQVNAMPNLDETAKATKMREMMTESLIRNKVVDDKWKGSIEAGLTGDIVGSDGKVNPQALQAYQDYLYLKDQSSAGYANEYLGKAKDIVAMAEQYDVGGVNSEQALITASTIMSKKADGTFVQPTINEKSISMAAEKSVDGIDPGFFSLFGGGSASDTLDIKGWEIEQVKKDPQLRSLIESNAIRYKISNPNMSDEAAAAAARKDLQGRVEIVMGNAVIGGTSSSIRKDMGIEAETRSNAADKAMRLYLTQFGEKLWGSRFNEFQVAHYGDVADKSGDLVDKKILPAVIGDITGNIPQPSFSSIANSVHNQLAGYSPVKITYNADLKGYVVDMYANPQRTAVVGDPKFIPASEVGMFYKEALNAHETEGLASTVGRTLVNTYLKPPHGD